MANRLRQSGNVFFALMGAIAVAGILSYGVNSYIRGPLKTAVKMTKQDAAESQMNIAGQLSVMSAAAVTGNGDCDSDGYTEPLEWRDAGSLPKPTGGGLIPNAIGVKKTDPWGTQYGYCAWDAGPITLNAGCQATSPGTNMRLEGANSLDYPVVAIISAGPDRIFTTTCRNFSTGADRADQNNNGVLTDAGDRELVSKANTTDDDIIMKYTYTTAMASSGGLWILKSGDNTTATIDKNIEAQNGTFSGIGRFSSLEASTTDYLDFISGLKLAGPAVVTACNSAAKGVLRLNASATTIEMCDGINAWVTAIGGDGSVTTPAPVITGRPADCSGLGTHSYNDTTTGQCYYAIDGAYTYAAAEAACEADDAHLAVVTSSDINTIIRAWGGNRWYGMDDTGTEGTWIYKYGPNAGTQFWSGNGSGSAVGGAYTNWHSGEPDGGSGENCLMNNYSNWDQWVDYPCGNTTDAVCEKETNIAGGFDDLSDAIANYTTNNFFVGSETANDSVTGTKNTLLGIKVGTALTTGSENSLFGEQTMYNVLTTGSHNTIIGSYAYEFSAGSYNTSFDTAVNQWTPGSATNYNTSIGKGIANYNGTYSVSLGPDSLNGSGAATGSYNVSAGNYTANALTTGAYNVFLGGGAGETVTTGSSMVGIGNDALHNVTTTGASGVVAIGEDSLYNLNGGSTTVTGVGHGAMYSDGTLSSANSTAIGSGAIDSLTSGASNTAIGNYVLSDVTTTAGSTGIGHHALDSNTKAGQTAVGQMALNAANANYETAIGSYAGMQLSGGASNTLVGYGAMAYPDSSGSNVIIGGITVNDDSATYTGNVSVGGLRSLSTSGSNIAIGMYALDASTTSDKNVAIGAYSQYAGTSTSGNTSIGYEALRVNTGTKNTAVGHDALVANTSGGSNTAVGSLALRYNTTGSTLTGVGYDAGPASGSTGLSNSTAIGNGAQFSASNYVRVGNTSITTITAKVAYAASSDRRLKKDILPSDLGLEFIMSLKPVVYRMKQGNGRLDYGFLAQDVEESLDGRIANMVTRQNDEIKTYQMRQADLMAPMVKAIQEQDETIKRLKAKIAALKEQRCQKGNVQ